MQKCQVYVVGQPVGEVRRDGYASFHVLNAEGQGVLYIACAQACICECGQSVDFPVYLTDQKTQVGQITKQVSTNFKTYLPTKN